MMDENYLTHWRHIKSNTFYFIMGECRLEATNEEAYLYELRDGLNPYQKIKGVPVWARSKSEFLDGRFEQFTPQDFEKLHVNEVEND